MGIVIRQSIRGSIVNYIGAFIGFLSTMFVVTKFLLPEDIGLYTVIFHVAVLFAGLAQLGTSSSILRFFPYFKDKNKNHNGFFFYIVALPLIGCLIFIPLYLLLKEPIIAFFGRESQLFTAYFYWVIPLIVFLTFWAIFETYSNANMRIVFPKMAREVIIRLLLMAVFLLYGLHAVNRDEFISLFVIAHGIVMLVMFFYVSRIAPISLRHNFSFINKPLRKDIRNYTGILLLGTLGSLILGRLDLFIVSSELGFELAGVYTIALFMGTMVEIPARSITAISAPIASTALRENNLHEASRLYKKVSLNQLIIGGLIFVLIWINIDNIFKIIPNGEVYVQGKWVVFFIGLARLISMTLNFGGILITFSKYYRWTIVFTFVVAGIGIAANYLLIPKFGINGSAIAVLITVILSCAFQQWIVLRKLNSSPYTKGTLKMVLILLVLFAGNHLLPTFSNPFLDLALRTSIIGIIALSAIYFGKVSDDMSGVIREVLWRVKK
jgi:O-antigen/teichoic acid export membrane protein